MNSSENFEDLITKAVTHIEREYKLKRIQQIQAKIRRNKLIFRKLLPRTGIAAAILVGVSIFYFQWMQANDPNATIHSKSVLTDNSDQNDSSIRFQSIVKHLPNQVQIPNNENTFDSSKINLIEIPNQSVSSVLQAPNNVRYRNDELIKHEESVHTQPNTDLNDPGMSIDGSKILTNPNQTSKNSTQIYGSYENKLYKLNGSIKEDSLNVRVIIKSGLQTGYTIQNDTLVLSFVGVKELKLIINCFEKHSGKLMTWIDKQYNITIDTRNCFGNFTYVKKY
ncbi:MAG: hypothetical protein JNL65_04825 [Saprospiraceae bacterium]|nr:hypothetical protein [Saprospiraceae bacterium]